ncbi:hypothetical protein [Streptomyces boninensis]|uniref:hypothetical protein n=1 Tax=Streptomyces boninensis TaxID=2039455 RepID=UPI003B218D9B
MTADARPTRRAVVAATAAAAAATVALPAWPARAAGPRAAAADAGAPVLDPHPDTEPSGTHVRQVGGTGVVFAYGQVLPSFDGWRTREPTREYARLDGRWRFAFDPDDSGKAAGWHRPDHDDSDWLRAPVPGTWDLLDTPGFAADDPDAWAKGTAFTDGYAWWQAASLRAHWAQVTDRAAYVAGYTFWVLKDYKQRAGYNQDHNGISVMGLMDFTGGRRKLAYDAFRRAANPKEHRA